MHGGGSTKLRRFGGRKTIRDTKRACLPPPPPHPSGVQRTRTITKSTPTATSASLSMEENFSIVSGDESPAFAMIVRLTPELVDEINRVEARGDSARIKFDSIANNTSGNVIGVGDKNFGFTWSSEMGDLCGIFEERQIGEDRGGLLIETGCAWRKLNVQRVLDESTTNHVKLLSEEADRKHKSRKAIVLEHRNSSMKNQNKALAAPESMLLALAAPQINLLRIPSKQMKAPAFKRQKFEPSQGNRAAVTSLKPANHVPAVSTSALKNNLSASPRPAQSDQIITSTSPFGIGTNEKTHVVWKGIIPTPVVSKEKKTSYEKQNTIRTSSAARGTQGSKRKCEASPIDLQSMMISLLMENPKGMSRKALEKAIGDTTSKSKKTFDSIIKRISTFQAPGRYILKPGFEMENTKTPLSGNGSSPENNRRHILVLEDNFEQTPASEPSVVEKIYMNEHQEEAQLNSKLGEQSTAIENIDVQHHSVDLLAEKNVSCNSDKESDSGDNESDSQSRSDIEGDVSFNSKEGSDEDVDIMESENDKEPTHKLEVCGPSLPVSPNPWKIDNISVPIESDERQEDHVFSAVEIERILPNIQETKISFCAKESGNPATYNAYSIRINDERIQSHDNNVQPSLTMENSVSGLKKAILLESNNGLENRRESFSDEISFSYYKFEKDEPEPKGPIKDISQYDEYVLEYRDKYDSYWSLNKTLETDRSHFQSLGKELEFSKGTDMDRYNNLLGQLKDSYYQYGPRHKRLKKIFIVLHEELKTLKERVKDYALQCSNG